MPSYIDCPLCASEILVSEEITENNVRCPDCLQWMDNQDTDHDNNDALSYKKYYGNSLQLASGSYYDNEDDYGYDY